MNLVTIQVIEVIPTAVCTIKGWHMTSFPHIYSILPKIKKVFV